MLENEFFKKVENYIFNLFKTELPPEVVYHNFEHTNQVVQHAFEIGVAEGFEDNDLEMILLASWFHDIGFVKGYEKHEEKSKEIAEKYLLEVGYPLENIAIVKSLICVTKMPQKPTNKMEEIICDADLYHLGTENFREKTILLRSEWEQLCNKNLNDVEFLTENEKFLKAHKYFTNYAFSKLTEQKNLNWLRVQKDLKKTLVKNKELEEKNKLKKAELKLKKEKSDRPERGIETMYRVTLRNHIKLSDIADTKANILLSVSAIILSIALSNLFQN